MADDSKTPLITQLSRRRLLGTLGAFSLYGLAGCSEEQQTQAPAETPAPAVDVVTNPISRLKMGTIGTAELEATEEAYTNWLGHNVLERGEVSEALAKSWGTPRMAGRPYVVMEPESGNDVFIRAVEINDVPGYKPMTTFGWNAFELIVDDIMALNEQLEDSPFEVIGEPASLGGNIASIWAMQVRGPGNEILYFNTETGDRSKSTLPIPESFVDRLNIAILAGADAKELAAFYTSKLQMQGRGGFDMPVGVISTAQGLPPETMYRLEMITAREGGNLIEIDGYPAGAATTRPVNDGELPPGNAMISFSIDDLGQADVDYLSDPISDDGIAYNGSKSGTFVGPAGELVELIEEKRS